MMHPPHGIADHLLYILLNLPPDALAQADFGARIDLINVLRASCNHEDPQSELENSLTTAEEWLEELHDKLKDLSRAVPNWLLVDRKAIVQKIVRKLFKQYRALPSPEPCTSKETGLDFLAHLEEEGSDHGLYESSMQQLDSEIYAAIKELHPDEIVALLMPMEQDDLEDLFREGGTVENWNDHLMRHGTEWPERMRHIVLDRVRLGQSVTSDQTR